MRGTEGPFTQPNTKFYGLFPDFFQVGLGGFVSLFFFKCCSLMKERFTD